MSLTRLLSGVCRNNLFRKRNKSHFAGFALRHFALWEPDYLILGETKTPEYDLINVQITGYDFAILENYQSLIHKLAKQMKIKINLCWPTPPKEFEIHHYRPNSAETQYKYKLKLCERNVQVIDVKSHVMSLFIEAIITACPPGVKLSIHEHEDSIENDRYIPNMALLELEKELESFSEKKGK